MHCRAATSALLRCGGCSGSRGSRRGDRCRPQRMIPRGQQRATWLRGTHRPGAARIAPAALGLLLCRAIGRRVLAAPALEVGAVPPLGSGEWGEGVCLGRTSAGPRCFSVRLSGASRCAFEGGPLSRLRCSGQAGSTARTSQRGEESTLAPTGRSAFSRRTSQLEPASCAWRAPKKVAGAVPIRVVSHSSAAPIVVPSNRPKSSEWPPSSSCARVAPSWLRSAGVIRSSSSRQRTGACRVHTLRTHVELGVGPGTGLAPPCPKRRRAPTASGARVHSPAARAAVETHGSAR